MVGVGVVYYYLSHLYPKRSKNTLPCSIGALNPNPPPPPPPISRFLLAKVLQKMQRLKSQATHLIRHRWTLSSAPVTAGRPQPSKPLLVKPDCASSYSHISRMIKDESQAQGTACLAKEQFRWCMMGSTLTNQFSKHTIKHRVTPYLARTAVSNYSTQSSAGTPNEEMRKDVSKVEDQSGPLTYNIPEKPVTFVEGASYSFIILVGLGVAAFAAYAVLKELVFEPKEYTIFGEALKRVQNDSQVAARIGRPITGYGSESRNRAARQRIYNKVWRDAEGAEHVEVRFYIRGPHGTGQVRAEMLKNDGDRVWQFVDLTVVITSPSHAQFILESYIPTYQTGPGSLSMNK